MCLAVCVCACILWLYLNEIPCRGIHTSIQVTVVLFMFNSRQNERQVEYSVASARQFPAARTSEYKRHSLLVHDRYEMRTMGLYSASAFSVKGPNTQWWLGLFRVRTRTIGSHREEERFSLQQHCSIYAALLIVGISLAVLLKIGSFINYLPHQSLLLYLCTTPFTSRRFSHVRKPKVTALAPLPRSWHRRLLHKCHGVSITEPI